MISRDGPIGVFDSGIGGLTVTKEILKQLPRESVLYFGDTARVPYGSKSPDTVRRYSREIADFLTGEGVKALVIACNTATAHALDALRLHSPLPVIGVVDPGARAASAASVGGHIGVIGTGGTIKSGAYERAIRAFRSEASIVVKACPLLVPLVEEGWIDHPVTRIVAEEYLSPFRTGGVDTLVLGCTHYPLLKELFADILGPSIRLIDSAAETAAETARVLHELSLTAPEGCEPRHRFIVSDDPLQFLQLGQRFLGHAIEGVEVRSVG